MTILIEGGDAARHTAECRAQVSLSGESGRWSLAALIDFRHLARGGDLDLRGGERYNRALCLRARERADRMSSAAFGATRGDNPAAPW